MASELSSNSSATARTRTGALTAHPRSRGALERFSPVDFVKMRRLNGVPSRSSFQLPESTEVIVTAVLIVEQDANQPHRRNVRVQGSRP